MTAVCLYFEVHVPLRLRKDYTFFNVGHDHSYEDEECNRAAFEAMADNCYLPANKVMLGLLKDLKGDFKVSFSISGLAVDGLQRYRPAALDSFRALADTGCVEFINETYYHSLAFLYSKSEFQGQVAKHAAKMKELFGAEPTTFRNTELIYNNDLASVLESMGFKTVLSEGPDCIFGWRTTNYVYQPAACRKLVLLPRNHRLSRQLGPFPPADFVVPGSSPADKFANIAHAVAGQGEVLNVFLPYESFAGNSDGTGKETLELLAGMPVAVLRRSDFCFKKPCEVVLKNKSGLKISVPHSISWAEEGSDISPWLGSAIQDAAIEYLYKLEKKVRQTNDEALIEQWRRLQCSDHFRCMWAGNRNSRCHFDSPQLAHIVYMNVLNDLNERIKLAKQSTKKRGRKTGEK